MGMSRWLKLYGLGPTAPPPPAIEICYLEGCLAPIRITFPYIEFKNGSLGPHNLKLQAEWARPPNRNLLPISLIISNVVVYVEKQILTGIQTQVSMHLGLMAYP